MKPRQMEKKIVNNDFFFLLTVRTYTIFIIIFLLSKPVQERAVRTSNNKSSNARAHRNESELVNRLRKTGWETMWTIEKKQKQKQSRPYSF